MSTQLSGQVTEIPFRPSKVYFGVVSALHCIILIWGVYTPFLSVAKASLVLALAVSAWVWYRHWRQLRKVAGLRIRGGSLLLLNEQGEAVSGWCAVQPMVCNPLLVIFKCARGGTIKQLPIVFDSVAHADMRRLGALCHSR